MGDTGERCCGARSKPQREASACVQEAEGDCDCEGDSRPAAQSVSSSARAMADKAG